MTTGRAAAARRGRVWTVAVWLGLSILAVGPGLAGEETEAERKDEAAQVSAKEPAVDHCVACHTEDDNLPEHFLDADIHMKPGLSCAGCHGGNPAEDDQDRAMSAAAGFRGVPSKEQIPAFCGRCHSDIDFMRQYQPRIPTDQESQYASSVHGHRLKQHDQKVADCTSCHTAHGILPASDTRSTVHAMNVPATCGRCHGDAEYMAPYGIPTNQLEEFKRSVHGVALLEKEDTGAPACNDCHGNHGATPPGITSITQVCGQCHANNMRYFTESRMGRAFVEEGYHGCEECHGNHGVKKTSDSMVGNVSGAVCVDCHSEGDVGFETAGKIHASLASLSVAQENALSRQTEVQRIGMDDVDIGFLLQESHQSLIESRTLVHTFDPEKVGAKTTEGLAKANEALDLAARQIKDFHVRRRGFGMATLFTTILALALFLKIRQLDSR
jgi:predicted CXXCH cytochrome family protein